MSSTPPGVKTAYHTSCRPLRKPPPQGLEAEGGCLAGGIQGREGRSDYPPAIFLSSGSAGRKYRGLSSTVMTVLGSYLCKLNFLKGCLLCEMGKLWPYGANLTVQAWTLWSKTWFRARYILMEYFKIITTTLNSKSYQHFVISFIFGNFCILVMNVGNPEPSPGTLGTRWGYIPWHHSHHRAHFINLIYLSNFLPLSAGTASDMLPDESKWYLTCKFDMCWPKCIIFAWALFAPLCWREMNERTTSCALQACRLHLV